MDFSADPHWDNVKVLLQFDSGQRNDVWIANMAGGWSSVFQSGVNVVDTTDMKWGDGCYYGDGTSSNRRLYDATSGSVGTNFGTGDFTVEFWIKLPAAGHGQDWARVMESIAQGTAGGWLVYLGLAATNPTPIYFFDSVIGVGVNTGNISNDVWHHVAFSRVSGTLRSFLDGVLVQSVASTYNFTQDKLTVGSNTGGTANRIKGYIDDIRITKGIGRYTASFAVPTKAFPRSELSVDTTAYDEHYESVVSLLHFNGFAGVPLNSGIRDETGRAWTPNSTVAVNSTVSKYGGSSLDFTSTDDTWASTPHTADLSVATGDFTIECWFRLNELGRIQTLSNKRPYATTANEHSLYVTASNTLAASMWNADTLVADLAGSTAVTTGIWYHAAFCRSGSTCYLFLNGVLQASGTQSGAPGGNTSVLYIGRDGFVNYTRDLNGYMDEYRFTRVCRYTAGFTVPATQFRNRPPITDYTPVVNTYDPDPHFASVTVLAHANNVNATDNKFVNETGMGNFIVEQGIPFIASGKGKFGHGAYCFDGYSIAKYKDIGTTGLGAFGTGDFTVELWAKIINNGRAGSTTWPRLLATSDYLASPAGWYISINVSTPNFRFERSPASTFFDFPTVANDTWYHLAISRVSGVTYFFLNGVLRGSQADTTNYTNTGLAIGGHITGSLNNYEKFRGYLDEIRITKGVGRYTATFTPPTNPSALSYIVTEALSIGASMTWEMRSYLDSGIAVAWDMTSWFENSQDLQWGRSADFTVRRCLSWGVLMPITTIARPMAITPSASSSTLTPVHNPAALNGGLSSCED